ncbi:hypothetical protein [Exiguobacterium sp. KRL4]|uniref:hypothetical protein n=1 Tax=Exiguobacterium sp. KRL4 TaxID=1914536 RepID=UPI001F26631A|nr:hypothetical protein [Exiguobacterium sp. KRL4]
MDILTADGCYHFNDRVRFGSVLYSLLFPAVFLTSNIRYQFKKRRILESYIGEELATKQWRFWIIYQVILYTIFVILMVATMDRPFWQMWLALMIILIPLYAICERMYKKIQLRDDPDFVSDQEVLELPPPTLCSEVEDS